jgi:hypothetical protein
MLLDARIVRTGPTRDTAFEVSEERHVSTPKCQPPTTKLTAADCVRLWKLEVGSWKLLLIQQLRVLLLLKIVDHRDVLVGDLLYFVQAAPLVVF